MSRRKLPSTLALRTAAPRLAVEKIDARACNGESPSPLHPPAACHFHPRCPHANARCRVERPVLLAIEGVKVACHAVEEGRI